MVRISKCPECGQKVTIVDDLDETAEVRCPLCRSEFPLSGVIADAEEAPPELIPVAASPSESAAETAEPKEDAAAARKEAEAEGPAGEGPSVTIWEHVAEAPKIDTGTPDEAAHEVAAGLGGIQFGGVKTGDEVAESTDAASAAGGLRCKREKSAVREIVGIVLGGAAGVLLAYYGLNLFGGPRFDFADVYLPGIQHTAKHRPDWWPGWLRFEGEPEAPGDNGADEDASDPLVW